MNTGMYIWSFNDELDDICCRNHITSTKLSKGKRLEIKFKILRNPYNFVSNSQSQDPYNMGHSINSQLLTKNI